MAFVTPRTRHGTVRRNRTRTGARLAGRRGAGSCHRKRALSAGGHPCAARAFLRRGVLACLHAKRARHRVRPQVDVVGHMAGYLPINPCGIHFRGAPRDRARDRAQYFVRDWYERVFCVAAARHACELHCPTRSPARIWCDWGSIWESSSQLEATRTWQLDRRCELGIRLLESLGARQKDIWSPGSRG